MMQVTKDPAADLDYVIDWSAWLGDDAITSSSWSAPADSGITVHDDSIDSAGKLCTVWLRGGNASSAPYRVTNQIVTAAGRREERPLSVKIQPKQKNSGKLRAAARSPHLVTRFVRNRRFLPSRRS